MNFINPIKSLKRQQKDKFEFVIRISVLTIMSIKIDISAKFWEVKILNLGVGSDNK